MAATVTKASGTGGHCLEPLMREVLSDLATLQVMLDITQHSLDQSDLMLRDNDDQEAAPRGEGARIRRRVPDQC